MELIQHMIDTSTTYVRDILGKNPETQMQLHIHKPLFTTIKHLHIHVVVGQLSFKGMLFFSRCVSNDPEIFTKKHFL